MSFGNKLKILRINHKLDQDAISKKLNISQPVYSRYENDEKKVTEENLFVQKVAEEFNVTAKWLLAPLSTALAEEESGYEMQKGNYYRVPKDFMDAFLKQQEMTARLLGLLGAENNKRKN